MSAIVWGEACTPDRVLQALWDQVADAMTASHHPRVATREGE
ncbi:hypothetical protein [Cellulomonas sp. P5_C5]